MSALPDPSSPPASPPRSGPRAITVLWLCIASLLLACVDGWLVVAHQTVAFDRTLLLDIHTTIPQGLGPAMRFVSLVGSPTGMAVIVALAAIYCVMKRAFAAGMIVVFSLLGAQL